MSLKIALAGNPNCGKTTFFNSLTEKNEYTGNRAGVTVEAKKEKLKNKKADIIDLPGIYSLSPYSPEEIVARKILIEEKTDAIINIVDATNLERNLYLTLQLIETGKPVIIALNMIDLLKSKIDIEKLSLLLSCRIKETSALYSTGISEVLAESLFAAQNKSETDFITYTYAVEKALKKIYNLTKSYLPKETERFYTIKIFERDENSIRKLKIENDILNEAEKAIRECEYSENDDSESLIASQKYILIEKIISECVKAPKNKTVNISDKIDSIVTNRYLFFPCALICFSVIYFFSVNVAGKLFGEFFSNFIFEKIINGFAEQLTNGFFKDLLQNCIINGVGGVISFLPQLTALFICLSLLEECGYMARIAFNFDGIFRKLGFSGKSVISFLLASGCGVSGIMSTRTIENQKCRKLTAITATFIPCSAKLPVIALIAAECFGGSWSIAVLTYITGTAAIVVSGLILKQFSYFNGTDSPFLMELPPYHIPSMKIIFKQTKENVKSFLVKAGTVIFLSGTIIWFLSSYNFKFQPVSASQSILAVTAKIISPLFAPLGWGNWQATVASITGLFAKENIISTFAVLGFSLKSFGKANALSFMLFNMLCAPCVAAATVLSKEFGLKLTVFALVYQTAFAYFISFVIYQAKNFNIQICLNTALFLTLSAFFSTIKKSLKKS